MNFKIAFTAAAALLTTFASAAGAATIDFSALAAGTAVTNQFAGVSVSLLGGVDNGPAIVADVFGEGLALTNSTTTYYPTAHTVNFAFGSGASDISFVYNNFGGGNGSSFSAYNGATLVSSGALDATWGYFSTNVTGSGITSLVLSNNNSTGWQFGVTSLSFTAGAVPEPQSWAMLIAGFGLVGAAMRRRSAALAA
ncbi:hypothetical protein GCM10011529_02970 [Polymorphobacter glacialis]|uniref:Ice-binding protein C-terminal domain-containing protein n=1 Tax=Sandarakinorhabdus glacialis TaxID=1614636 RepID=A0A917E4J8_9SPHN|nr:PEPxxWA-CTERM sorting domain-containing protein [Polymorphobacter glacialis]GGE00190.1 hypothetical protein GCM10011529_02970 [Polymorphobacter glacialis]